jgi:hypothetical protein
VFDGKTGNFAPQRRSLRKSGAGIITEIIGVMIIAIARIREIIVNCSGAPPNRNFTAKMLFITSSPLYEVSAVDF